MERSHVRDAYIKALHAPTGIIIETLDINVEGTSAVIMDENDG